MKRLILATKILALNPSAATRLTATRLTATHLAATHLTVWIFLWAALFGVAIPTSSYAQVAEICANGIDDDGDTLIDCDDPDCQFECGYLETDCTNGLDDDGDNLVELAGKEAIILQQDSDSIFQTLFANSLEGKAMLFFGNRGCRDSATGSLCHMDCQSAPAGSNF